LQKSGREFTKDTTPKIIALLERFFFTTTSALIPL